MTSTLTEAETLSEVEQERLTAVMFAQTATIKVVNNHIKSLQQVAGAERRETCFLERIPAPTDVEVATVRWLLGEGSNLQELYREVGDNLFARYILDRRALAIIGEKYPSLKGAVISLIRTDYRPNKWPPICIAEGYERFRSDKLDLTDEANEHYFLNHAYLTQTDVLLLLEIHRKASKARKKAIKAKCFLAVGDTFPEFAEVARAKAEKLDPSIKKQ